MHKVRKSMISKRFLSLSLAALLLASSVMIGCNKDDPNADFDPDAPGDDFSGSISKEDENKKEEDNTPVDEGNENQTYYISNADELMAMKRKGTYILTADIDMTGKEWKPVGTFDAPFVGTFNGEGFTVKGLTVTKDTEGNGECISYTYTYAGLFGFADNASIQNVKLEDVNINVSSTVKTRVIYAGAIAAMTRNTKISGCEIVSGSIKSASPFFKSYSAGITAFSLDSDFTECKVNASVEVSDSKVISVSGGIAAHIGMNSKIATSAVTGTVTAVSTDGNAYAGGLAGYLNNSDISYSSVNAEIKAETKCSESETGKAGASFAGGISAYATSTSTNKQRMITAVSSHGSVLATSADYVSYAGGITAYSAYLKLTESYSAASVTASSTTREVFAGGISGYVSSKTEFVGIFFAGSLNARSSKDVVRTGTVSAYDATANSDEKTVIEKAGRLPGSELSVTVNGKKYNVGDKLPEDEFFASTGDEYTSNELRSKNVLTGDLGWNEANWNFSMSAYPTVNFEGYYEIEIPENNGTGGTYNE